MRSVTPFLLFIFISTALFSQEATQLKLYLPDEDSYNSYELQSSFDEIKQKLLFNGESATLVINDEPEGRGKYTILEGIVNFTIEDDNSEKVFEGRVFNDTLLLNITTYVDNEIVEESAERVFLLNNNGNGHISPEEINIPDEEEIVVEEHEIEEEKADQIFQIVEQPAVPKGGIQHFINSFRNV